MAINRTLRDKAAQRRLPLRQAANLAIRARFKRSRRKVPILALADESE
jgi:hypothetical protein